MASDKTVRSITYYLPNKIEINPASNVSVVLLTDGHKIARGVAILNNKDMFDRKRGRAIAMGRATKAFTNEQTCPNNRITRGRASIKTPAQFYNKCIFMPELTDYENQLLTSK